jgi:hypothetical protein
LPADLLAQFEPWRSGSNLAPPQAHWDPLAWDGIAQYYPWRHFYARSLRAGLLPLWNPHQFCGTPFLANMQSAVFYPFTLLFLVLPVSTAFAWSAALHLLLAGWFAYLLLRALGAGRFGSVLGGSVFALNGYFAAWMHLPTVLDTACWLPLVLLLLEKFLRRGQARFALGAGLALALSFLAGHPQVFLYVALAAVVYLLARGLGLGWRRLLRVGGGLALIAVVLLPLVSVQLLPTLELMRHSHRAPAAGLQGYAAYLRWTMPPSQLVTLLLPGYFGYPKDGSYQRELPFAEYSIYCGLLPLLFALLALTRRERLPWGFALAAALCLLAALGTGVNYPLFFLVPGIARSGGPARILVLFGLLVGLLAGLGADHFGRLAVAGQKRAATRLAQVALLVLVALPLIRHSYRLIHFSRPEWVYPPVPALEALAGKPGRVLGLYSHWNLVYPAESRFPDAILPPNAATVYGLYDVLGYDSLYLASYRAALGEAEGRDPSPPANGNLLLARADYRPGMLAAFAVGPVLSSQSLPRPGLRLVSSDGIKVYENRQPAARAWLEPTPAEHAPIGRTPLAVSDVSPNRVRVSLSLPGERASLPLPAPGRLLLLDAFYPGWRARVDGLPRAIEPAGAFRALSLPAGARQVEMSYQPASFRVGLFLSLLGALGLCAAAGFLLSFARDDRGRRRQR